jgi:hypothetical protein
MKNSDFLAKKGKKKSTKVAKPVIFDEKAREYNFIWHILAYLWLESF